MVEVGSGVAARVVGCGECLDGYVQGECPRCKGRGCDDCSGEGFLVAECEACGGTGRISGDSVSAAEEDSGWMSELEEAAVLARNSEAMRETFEQGQAAASAAKADRERRDLERAYAEEAKRAPARDRLERIYAMLAVVAAVGTNLLYDYLGKAKPFGLPLNYDPLSRAVIRAVPFLRLGVALPLRWLVLASVALALWVPLGAAFRRIARIGAFQRYPAVAGATPAKRPMPSRTPWFQIAGIVVLAVVLWLNVGVFPRQFPSVSSLAGAVPSLKSATKLAYKTVGPIHVDVHAWNGADPGISVEPGSRVTIRATGRWTHGREGGRSPYYGPEGYIRKAGAGASVPNARLGALVYCIDDTLTDWRPVGRHISFVSTRGGHLRFGMNVPPQDPLTNGLDGSIAVSVTVSTPTQSR